MLFNSFPATSYFTSGVLWWYDLQMSKDGMFILKIFFTNALNNSPKQILTNIYCNTLHVWLSIPLQPMQCLSLWLCDGRQGLVLHDGIFKSPPGEMRRIFVPSPLCRTRNPTLNYSYSGCGPVIEYNLTAVIVGSFQTRVRMFKCTCFFIYNNSSLF